MVKKKVKTKKESQPALISSHVIQGKKKFKLTSHLKKKHAVTREVPKNICQVKINDDGNCRIRI